MKFVDEFRDPKLGKQLLKGIAQLAAQIERPVKLMEVCGGHTHAIFRFGLEALMPDNVDLVHGPGCPVCVLPVGRVDDAIAIAEHPNVVFATYGDAMRVPGSKKSLLGAKAEGCDVRTVYSPVDALAIAQAEPEKEVVFFGLGFETTTPSTALTVKQAEALGVTNFSIFSNHITIVPTLKALLDSAGERIDGFVGPGHVSMVIGLKPYDFVTRDYRKPIVVSGFEPLDVLQAIHMVLTQIAAGEAKVENQYARVVRDGGNPQALQALLDVFELRSYFEWRGLGTINHSGLQLREAYAAFDAEKKFAVPHLSVADPKACQCGEVLKGALKPWECKVFGTACTPETPIGSCMVSSEGACAAYYNYGRLSVLRKKDDPPPRPAAPEAAE
ncbi:MAG: hydrogenase formation protein HypD [Myxococcota bacterium]